MLGTRFPPWPSFTEDEIAAVAEVLRSGRVNNWTGQEVRRFETEFAEWTGARHAIALANGTVALDLALRGLGIGPGDEVIVTPRSFIASVSCVVNAGAIPVFADVNRDSGNLSAETIAGALAMLRQITEFNQGRTAALVLKVGIHKGAAIAVTLNDRLDYFGQTVNIAARVQGLADAGEICLTQEVRDARGVGSAWLAEVGCVLSREEPSLPDGRGDVVGRAAEVVVVPVRIAGHQPPYLMVQVVGPHAVEVPPVLRGGGHHPREVTVILRDEQHLTVGRGGFDTRGELGQDVTRALVLDRVRRVEPQAVHVVLVHPVHRVLDDELAHRAGALAVQVDARSPRTLVPLREVVRAEDVEVRAVGTDVVVDHVQQDGQSDAVGRVDQAPQVVGRAVPARRREQRRAVVPQLRDPGKSATGISSIAVAPRSRRYGSRASTPAKVPSGVKVPTCSS